MGSLENEAWGKPNGGVDNVLLQPVEKVQPGFEKRKHPDGRGGGRVD